MVAEDDELRAGPQGPAQRLGLAIAALFIQRAVLGDVARCLGPLLGQFSIRGVRNGCTTCKKKRQRANCRYTDHAPQDGMDMNPAQSP